ncbi:class I SAM-dependent methyltransferase, partial [Candidatus Bathyarchaeota archaeon]|nr:class I SAM-dependent methyltransferase [Candidatus Bathyarchaeota archaeon]
MDKKSGIYAAKKVTGKRGTLGKEYFEAGPYGGQSFLIIKRNYKILFDHGKTVFPRLFEKHLNMLDFGCALGAGTSWLSKHVKGTIVGVDISSYAIQEAKKMFPCNNIFFYKLDLSKRPDAEFLIAKHGVFDAFFSRDTIEHIPREKHRAVLRNLFRLLADNGVVLASVANGLNPYSYFCDRTHVGLRTPFSYNNLFKESGFEIVKSFEKQGIPVSRRSKEDELLKEVTIPIFGFAVYIFAKKKTAQRNSDLNNGAT